jgi:hypothetical protein
LVTAGEATAALREVDQRLSSLVVRVGLARGWKRKG